MLLYMLYLSKDIPVWCLSKREQCMSVSLCWNMLYLSKDITVCLKGNIVCLCHYAVVHVVSIERHMCLVSV